MLKQLGYLGVGLASLKEGGKGEIDSKVSLVMKLNFTVVIRYLQRISFVLLCLLHWHYNSKGNYAFLRVCSLLSLLHIFFLLKQRESWYLTEQKIYFPP